MIIFIFIYLNVKDFNNSILKFNIIFRSNLITLQLKYFLLEFFKYYQFNFFINLLITKLYYFILKFYFISRYLYLIIALFKSLIFSIYLNSINYYFLIIQFTHFIIHSFLIINHISQFILIFIYYHVITFYYCLHLFIIDFIQSPILIIIFP